MKNSDQGIEQSEASRRLLLRSVSKPLLWLLGLLLLALLGYVNYWAGYHYRLALFYLVPIGLLSIRAGRWHGLGMSVLAALVLFLVEWSLGPSEVAPAMLVLNIALRWGIFVLFVFVLSALQDALRRETFLHEHLEELVQERTVALRKVEASLAEAQQVAHIGSWELNLQKNELWWSDEVYRIFGVKPQEFGATYEEFLSFIHPDDRKMVDEAYRTAIEKKTPYDVVHRIVRRDGEVRYVHERSEDIVDKMGKVVRSIGTVQDITERKKAEEVLRSASAYARSLIEASLDSLVTIGPDGKITDVNRATEEVTGLSRDKLIGTDFSDYFTELEKARAGYKQVFEKGTVRDYPLEIRRRDGYIASVLYNASVYRDEGGKVVGVFAAARDITETKRLEQQLYQVQKMEALGRFVGGIAHDFNNLLVVIGGRARRALNRIAQNDPLRQEIEQLIRAEESASSLTRQLLAFGRKQVLQPRVLDLNAVVSSLEMMLRRLIGEDILLLTLAEPNLGRVRVDPSQIEQVIMNLVVNARDAMPNGGTLIIETSNVYLDENHPEGYLAPAGPYVLLDVRDTGCGMDAHTLSHIFEPFFTTKAGGKGTGLGLATVHGIVRQSGGDVRVYSKVGAGTTFKVYLPQVKEIPEIREKQERIEGKSFEGTETLLLVEDEDTVRELVALELQDLGYTVLEASNGSKALEICRNHNSTIHMVITDVVLPDISGPDMFNLLAKERPAIKVLYCSGYAERDILQKGIIDRGKPFLEKPFTAESLGRKVREVLNTS